MHGEVTDEAGEARKAREREFHDRRFAEESRVRTAKYYAVDAGKERYRELVLKRGPGSRVLEYGCGTGSLAFELAEAGAAVTAIDISPVAIQTAHEQATARGLKIDFVEMDAEDLRFDPDTFDVVCGSGILHHLDLDRAFAEIARVLAPEGSAVFMEPLGHNPVINLYRRATPKMRTDDEHPLLMDDFQRAGEHFNEVELEPFNLTALAGVALRRVPRGTAAIARLHRIDQRLFDRSKLARRWAWVSVLTLRGPRLARQQ